MWVLENSVLFSIDTKPILYARYVDIILLVESEEHITKLKEKMDNQSVLNCTYKIEYNKLPFLDVSQKVNLYRWVRWHVELLKWMSAKIWGRRYKI